MKNHEARIERLYALAEKIGRLGAETHNLIDDLSAKLGARRVAIRSTTAATPPPPRQHKKH